MQKSTFTNSCSCDCGHDCKCPPCCKCGCNGNRIKRSITKDIAGIYNEGKYSEDVYELDAFTQKKKSPPYMEPNFSKNMWKSDPNIESSTDLSDHAIDHYSARAQNKQKINMNTIPLFNQSEYSHI